MKERHDAGGEMGKAIRLALICDALVFLFFFGCLFAVLRIPQAALLGGIGAALGYLPLIFWAALVYYRRKAANH